MSQKKFAVYDNNTYLHARAGQYTRVPGFWIGGSSLLVHGTWVWYPSLQPPTYARWEPTEPNDRGHAWCMHLWRPFHFKWADYTCETPQNFVCETPYVCQSSFWSSTNHVSSDEIQLWTFN
jgi:hypothetical protein